MLSRRAMYPAPGFFGTRRAILSVVVACLFAGAEYSAGADPTVEEILRAWSDRRNQIESLDCEYHIEESRIGDLGVPRLLRPRAEQTTNAEVAPPVLSLRGTVTFRISGPKVVASIEWEPTGPGMTFPLNLQRDTRAFDGSINRELRLSPLLHMGHIYPSDSVDRHLTDLRLLAGVWLAIEPLYYLERFGLVTSMTIRNSWTNADGEEIVEVVVPGRDLEWCKVIQLNLRRAYLPIDVRTERNGRVTSSLSLTYTENEQIGWALHEWEDQRFDERPNPFRSRRCQIVRFDVNTPVPDDSFTIEFPEGTHIARYAGPGRQGDEKYFIASEDGQLVSIPSTQYRRTDVDAARPSRTNPSRLALVISLVLLFAVTAVYAYYRRRAQTAEVLE